MVNFKALSLKAIQETLSAELVFPRTAEESPSVSMLGEPAELQGDGLCFLISNSFVKDVLTTKASVLVTSKALYDKVQTSLPSNIRAVLLTADPYFGLAVLSAKIAAQEEYGDWRLSDAKALIHPTAKIDPSVRMAPNVSVGENAVIGARTVLLSNCSIGPNVKIGTDCHFFPGVVVYPSSEIGNRVRLHANVVIGGDGFGYAKGPRGSEKIWHLGRTIIQDDVEVGPGTTIDRGTLKDTIVERGAKIDNQVQIGHNGHIKAHAILCAQVGLAGNATVGRGAILAGKVGVADKLEIGDGAIVGPMSGLSKDVKPGEIFMGQIPAKPRREWWKLVAMMDRIPDMVDRIKALEKKE